MAGRGGGLKHRTIIWSKGWWSNIIWGYIWFGDPYRLLWLIQLLIPYGKDNDFAHSLAFPPPHQRAYHYPWLRQLSTCQYEKPRYFTLSAWGTYSTLTVNCMCIKSLKGLTKLDLPGYHGNHGVRGYLMHPPYKSPRGGGQISYGVWGYITPGN